MTENAWVSNDACVFDNARIFGDALVSGHAKVFDNARVCGEASMCEYAQACEYAVVSADAELCGHVIVSGSAEVFGDRIEKTNDLINITSNVDSYNITITPNHIKIGCQYHAKTTWFSFTDDQIRKMDGDKAVEWWHEWKPILQQLSKLREE